MKRLRSFTALIVSSLCVISSCVKAQDSAEKIQPVSSDKILIVYLSRTKNTKVIAGMIKGNVGGRMVELELQTPYPEDYKAIVDQVAAENASGFLPPLKTQIEDISQYEVIFVGFPTWGMQLPPPMKSFLKQYDLSGKTVVPFNTNAGYGTGSSFQTVKNLAPKSKVPEGFTTRGGIERDGILFVMEGEREVQAQAEVRKWLQKIGASK